MKKQQLLALGLMVALAGCTLTDLLTGLQKVCQSQYPCPACPPPAVTPLPLPVTTPQPPPPTAPTTCTGNEILCLPSFDGQRGENYGGDFALGEYRPASDGGLFFTVTIDTSRAYQIEFEIEGGLTNPGMCALFTVNGTANDYWLMLQRADGGTFRGYFSTPDNSNPSNIITTIDFGDPYSSAGWGKEAHRFKVLMNQYAYQVQIDDFKSVWGVLTNKTVKLGVKETTLMLGNYHSHSQDTAAQTWFKSLKVSYQ